MQHIYLDNFRGFQDTLIPIMAVNFCVGENSSGKTSLLSAINLLASGRFWFEQNFEGDETVFKNYDDYVSVASLDKSYFRMGVVNTNHDPKGISKDRPQNRVAAFLFTYAEQEGVPKLRSCTTNVLDKSITLYFTQNAVRYRIRELDKNFFNFSKKSFNEWSKIQDDRTLAGTKVLKDESVSKGYMPALYALTMAVREAFSSRDKDSKRAAHLMFPGSPFGGEAAWIAPIRTKPRRTYDEMRLEFSPEGQHMPYLVKKLLSGDEGSKKFVAFLKRFGKESGLFKQINVHKFGTSATSPFELEVVLETKPLNISNVGYGVSQGLPVIVEAFSREPGTLFAIQQPEVHLHPRAQAAIGEMIFSLASRENKRFIVETHSDFTIDRYRVSLRESKDAKISSQILFFARIKGKNVVSQIIIREDGELPDDQPSSYRSFFLKEGLKVIGL